MSKCSDEKYGIPRKTCITCVRGKLSSKLHKCVECLKTDTPDNRFPNWEGEDADTPELD